jgi:hypothetical protein
VQNYIFMDKSFLARRRVTATAIGCLCGFWVGCQSDPWANSFLKGQPAENNLVGTYRVDSDTLTRRISVQETKKELSISRGAEIELLPDHKARFSQVPEIDESARETWVISGTGSWQLNRNDGYAVVNVQIQRRDYRRSVDACEPTYYGQLMLYGKKLPYKLHITIGDPDSGDALQFERANGVLPISSWAEVIENDRSTTLPRFAQQEQTSYTVSLG